MFRVHSGLAIKHYRNLHRFKGILNHSQFQPFSYTLTQTLNSRPLTFKASSELDQDPPVKRGRGRPRKSEDTPIKPVRGRRKKSVSSDAIEDENPKARSRRSKTQQATDEDPLSAAAEPKRRQRRKSASSETEKEKPKTRSKSAQATDGDISLEVVEAKPKRRRVSTTSDVSKDEKPKTRSKSTLAAQESSSTTLVEPKSKRRQVRSKTPIDIDIEGEKDANLIDTGEAEIANLEIDDGKTLEDFEVELKVVKRRRTGVKRPRHRDSIIPFNVQASEEPIENESVVLARAQKFIQNDDAMMQHLSQTHYHPNGQGDRTRVNIVHENLCDDILDRFGSSLTKHIGCDIIDINPGVGIWSSKIHNHLKPRTHILMEQDTTRFSRYLQPLLDAEGSTYKLIPKSGTVWGHLETAMSPEYLPHQKALSRDDPKINESNDTLLVLANLCHFPKRVFRGFASVSQLVMYQFLAAARSHALFHKYGLVRMLVWVPDDEKNIILPRDQDKLRKTYMEAQITCKSIREIASSTMGAGRTVQDRDLVLEEALIVAERMKQNGVTTPIHRQGATEVTARQLSAGEAATNQRDSHRWVRSYSDKLALLQGQFDRGELQMYLENGETNPDWQNLVHWRGKTRQFIKAAGVNDQLVDDYMEINQLSWQIKSMKPDSEEAMAATAIFQEKLATWESVMENMPTTVCNSFYARLDTRRVHTPYAKREAEPLRAYPKEFYPPYEHALIDIEPKALWPSLRENFAENYDVFEFIMSTIYMSPKQSVHEAFGSIWPGALEVIERECPSLFDPAKGGCWDLRYLTVRALTPEMMQEVIEAWLKWPFRPSRFDLMRRTGAMVHDPITTDDIFS